MAWQLRGNGVYVVWCDQVQLVENSSSSDEDEEEEEASAQSAGGTGRKNHGNQVWCP